MPNKNLKGKTLPSLIHEYIAWRKVTGSPNTIRAYQETLENFAHFCFDRKKDPIISRTINEWVAHLRVPVDGVRRKGGTVNVYVSRVHSFFEWTVQMGYISKNPTKLIPKLPPEASFVRGFKEEEVKKLLIEAGKDENRPYWPSLILLGHHYGMRIQDCCQFSATCIDWDNMSFTFMPQKQSRQEIELPLHDDLANALKAVYPGEEYYFPLAVERYHSNTIASEFRNIANAAGVSKKLSFHCLRHGAATNMIAAGIGLTTIVEIIGWTSTAMLQRYLDRDEKEIAKLKMSGSVVSPLPQCSSS